MKLSILIVNWNSKDYLRECLRSIQRTCSEQAPQVVVVDGGSYDGCAEMIAEGFPQVEFVQSSDNIGFGRSNNLGFEKVTGEALLLLNPDTELHPGAVQVMLRCLQQLPGAGLIGAKQLNSDGSLQFTSVHLLPTPWNAALDSDRARRRWWSRNRQRIESDAMEVEAISGACMMIRSDTFRKLGGFDPRYFMYAEDMDLCFRVRRAGLRIYHAHQAVLLHHGGGSSRTQFRKFPVIMLREALAAYFEINHGASHARFYRAAMAVSAMVRLPALCLGWLISGPARRWQRETSILKWWTILRWSLGFEKQPGHARGCTSKNAKPCLNPRTADGQIDADT